jgi:hypothetical protein
MGRTAQFASSLRVVAEPYMRPFASRLPTQADMTQGRSDGGDGKAADDGIFGRREQRIALLARASQAVRDAHLTAEQAGKARATAEQAHMTALENQALRVVERDALRDLEADVRRFADRLRKEGTPPEVAVRRLKATVDPVVYSNRDHDGGDVEWRRAVAGDVVRWFVEAYYAA